MKFFIDTAFVEEIREALALGVLDGVTTNPTLVAKTGRSFKEVILEICSLVPGPVSAEVVSLDAEGMVREGRELHRWAPNIVVKIPMTAEGLKAIKVLSAEGITSTPPSFFNLCRRFWRPRQELDTSVLLWGDWMIFPVMACAW